MSRIHGHESHQGNGLVAGSRTGCALAKERERQCCVQRRHWLFCSFGVPVAYPPGCDKLSEMG